MKKISAAFLTLALLISQKSFAMVPLFGGSSHIEGIGNAMQYIELINSVAIVTIKKDKEGAKQLAYTLGASATITQIGKTTFNHVYIDGKSMGERPNGSMNNFPSGHTSWTTANAWFVYKRYGIKYAALPIAGAVFTGYSRMHAKKHDIKAVATGALVGILSAEYFTTSFNQTNLKVSLVPTVENGRTGAMFNLSYNY